MEPRIYAAIDANINRSLEGLRVCEDIFRFVVLNNAISLKIKEIRHKISALVSVFPQSNLLHGRDVEKDAQKFIDLAGEKSRGSLYDLAKSNLHRAMEAMRSIEEFFKLIKPGAGENPFEQIRFSLYSLEKDIIPVLLREDKLNKFRSSLYAILDSAFVKDGDFSGTTLRFARGGASIIQLRMKGYTIRQILSVAKEVAPVCRENGVLFIVDDHPDIAYLSNADGVHLGQDDLSIQDARRILPVNMLIGISTHSREAAGRALEDLPDYIAIGPIYETKTKNNATLKGIGEDVIKDIYRETSIPIVAIGGLNPDRVKILKEIGNLSYAIISYLYNGNNIEENCRRIINAYE